MLKTVWRRMDDVDVPSHTVAELLRLYITEYLPHKAPSTQYNQGLLFRWLSDELGTIPLDRLSPVVLRSFRDSLTPYYRNSTIRRYLTALSAALTVAVEDLHWIEHHPLRRGVKPPEPPGRERCLSVDELRRLLEACQASSNLHLYNAVVLALCTALRKNELLHRQWSDIDAQRALLSVPHTKTGRLAVPLVPKAIEALQRQKIVAGVSHWVFPQEDGHAPIFIDYAWVRACQRAQIHDFHWHDLRHSSATFLAMSGANLEEIRAVLGHKTLTMTMRYVHLLEPKTRAVLEAMAQRFLSCILGAWAWQWLWCDAEGPATVEALAHAVGWW